VKQAASQRHSQRQGNSRFVARMIESHSILGLTFAAMIYVVTVTGAFTLFIPEITLWENPAAPTAPAVEPRIFPIALENALRQRHPAADVDNLLAYAPGPFSPTLVVRLNQIDGEGMLRQRNWFADPASGQLIAEVEAPLAHLVEQLHVALHLPPPWGRYLVGLIGVCMLCLLLSGILAHPSIFRDAFKLRLASNPRIAWLDLHNRLSVWGLPFHLVITFTGGFLGIAGLIVGGLALVAYEGDQEQALASLQGPRPVAGQPLQDLPPVARMVREATTAGDPVELLYIEGHDNSGGVTTINVLDHTRLDARKSFMFRNSGELIETRGGVGTPGGIRALAMLQPLHYGTFGGYTVKILYFVMSLALAWIISSGMQVWFARRVLEGRPAGRWQAAWHGTTAGLMLGLSGATLASACGVGGMLLSVCVLLWACTLSIFLCRCQSVDRDFRIVTLVSGLLLLGSVFTRFARHGPDAYAGSVVNVLITLLAASLIVFVWRGHRRQIYTGRSTTPDSRRNSSAGRS